MAIDNAGDDELPVGVDDLGTRRSLNQRTDFGNFAILDENGAVLDRAVRNRKDGGVLDQDDGGSVRRRSCRRRMREVNEVKEGKEVRDRNVGAKNSADQC